MKLIKIYDNIFIRLAKADKTEKEKKSESEQTLQKASAGTHKYIKRLPKPTGKGYIYFYTKEELKQYKETGFKPEKKKKKEEKKRSGIVGAWEALSNFFGITNETKFREKIRETYSEHEDEIKGVDISTFALYMNEYLTNKDKWDKKFEKKEIITKDKKTGKIDRKKVADKKTTVPDKKGGAWNMSLMKKIAGIVGGAKEDEDNFETMEEGKDETMELHQQISRDKFQFENLIRSGKQNSDEMKKLKNRLNKNETKLKVLEKHEALKKRALIDLKSGKNGKSSDVLDINQMESMNESYGGSFLSKKDLKIIKDAKARLGDYKIGAIDANKGFMDDVKDTKKGFMDDVTDNFETMPENEIEKTKDQPGNEVWKVAKDGEKYSINKTENGWSVSGGEIGAIQEGNKPMSFRGTKFADSPEQALKQHLESIKKSKEGKTEPMSKKEYEDTTEKDKKTVTMKNDFTEIKTLEDKISEVRAAADEEIKKLFPYKSGAKDFVGRGVPHDQQIESETNMWRYLQDKPNFGFTEKDKLKAEMDILSKRKKISAKNKEKLEKIKALYNNYESELNKRKEGVNNYKKYNEINDRVLKENAKHKKELEKKQIQLEKIYKKMGDDDKKEMRKIKDEAMYGIKLEKASKLLLKSLQKAKVAPVGALSPDGKYKKVGEGKWVPVGKDKKEKEKKPDKKEGKEGKEDKPANDAGRDRIKTAIKQVVNILTEALSGKDVVSPTGRGVEEAGESIKFRPKGKK